MNNERIADKYSDDEISLLDIWLILRDGWMILLATTITGVTVATVIAVITTPIYRANTVITEIGTGGSRQSVTSALISQFGGLAGIAGLPRGLGDNQSNGRTIILSRSFLEQFVAEQNLMPLLYADIWDEDRKSWDESIDVPPSLWQGANKFKEEVFSLNEDVETGLLTLSIEWLDATLAASWANRLVALANEIARQRDISEAEQSIAYLNEQIEKTNVVELQKVLYNLVEAEQKTLMLANAREDYVFQVVDPAMAPVEIARPNWILLIFLGTLLGGLLGLFIVFIRRVSRGLKEQELALRR